MQRASYIICLHAWYRVLFHGECITIERGAEESHSIPPMPLVLFEFAASPFHQDIQAPCECVAALQSAAKKNAKKEKLPDELN